MKHFGAPIAGALAMLALGVGSAAAASNFTTDGGAHAIADTPRNNVYDLVSNTSNASSADDYSYLTKTGSGTLAGISNLSADYYVRSGNCGGGSPRFSITLDTNHNGTSDGHVWVYLGDTPGFSCSESFQRWISTGDLTDTTDSRVDSSQLAGGAYGQTWAQAKTQFGSAGVLAVTFAVDGGWAVGGVQDVLVDNPLYNTKELGSPGG